MRRPFKELPGQPGVLRPVLSVRAAGTEGPPITCLLDTGSLHNRFGIWVAEVLGVDLDGAERGRLTVAGVTTTSLLVPLEPELVGFRWSAPVAFCDP